MSRSSSHSVAVNDYSVLDIFEFANSQQAIKGTLRLADLPRMLNEAAPNTLANEQTFSWHAVGESREVLVDEGKTETQLYLQLTISGSIGLICQRCLAEYEQPLLAQTCCRIVANEAQAEAAPLDEEVDVVVGSHRFNLLELLEDELLLALPFIPKHAACPVTHPVLTAASEAGKVDKESLLAQKEQEDESVNNPFAALAVLKREMHNGEE